MKPTDLLTTAGFREQWARATTRPDDRRPWVRRCRDCAAVDHCCECGRHDLTDEQRAAFREAEQDRAAEHENWRTER